MAPGRAELLGIHIPEPSAAAISILHSWGDVIKVALSVDFSHFVEN